MWTGRIARHLAAFLVTILMAGLIGATLVRFGPGFEADEQQLDPRLDAQRLNALRIQPRIELLFVGLKTGPEPRSEEHTSQLQSPDHLVCPPLLEKKNIPPVLP